MFHAHFTFDSPVINVLAGFKETVIHLEGEGRRQTDAMLTRYYEGDWDYRELVWDKARADAEMLGRISRMPTRVKLEFLGIPAISFTDDCYLEAHVKLSIPENRFESAKRLLMAETGTFGYRLSDNPRERRAGSIAQFVNLRIRHGKGPEAFARVRELVGFVEAKSLIVTSVQVETVAYDSSPERDGWWA